ncbi:MAG: radical SAM protein [bacterium]|nr:radical SAM protein [bacterium]
MIISWNVTRACNLRCAHCYRDAGARAPDELAADEALRLVDEIARAGFAVLILSGGEPLLRADLCDLVSRAARRGLRPVLGTNGTLLDRARARRLKEAGLARAGISLDGADPAAHDAFRGMAGAWRAAIGAMRACREEGLDFQVHTTVTRRTLGGIGAVTALAVREGARAHHVFFPVPVGRGKEHADLVLSPAEAEALLRDLLRPDGVMPIEIKPVCAPQFIRIAAETGARTRFSRGCLAGIAYCCILPGGDVHPCPYLPLRAGNVRERPFSAIWGESGLFASLRSRRYGGSCGRCAFRETCGGCRARAWAATGDPLAADPGCSLAGAA